MQEEFINEDSEEIRENFYNMKIKSSLGYIKNREPNIEEMEMNHRVLLEAEMKRELDAAFKEFGKKIYLGKDYERTVEKKESGFDGKGIEMLLNGLSGTQMGGVAEYE